MREALAIEIDSSLPAARVVRVLDQLRDSRPLPAQIRVDNGPELICATLLAWHERHGLNLHHIRPGKPTQNAYMERFNRTFRHEVLDAHLFTSLSRVREITHGRMIADNEERPHQALGHIPPRQFRLLQQANPKPKPTARNSNFEMSGRRGSLHSIGHTFYREIARNPRTSLHSIGHTFYREIARNPRTSLCTTLFTDLAVMGSGRIVAPAEPPLQLASKSAVFW